LAPRRGFFNLDWRSLADLRFGLLIANVPLPWYSAEYVFSFTMEVLLSHETLFWIPALHRARLGRRAGAVRRYSRNTGWTHRDHRPALHPRSALRHHRQGSAPPLPRAAHQGGHEALRAAWRRADPQDARPGAARLRPAEKHGGPHDRAGRGILRLQ